MCLRAIDWSQVPLPEGIRHSAPAFLREWDTEEIHGQCIEACDEFLHFLATHGVSGTIRTWNSPFFSATLTKEMLGDDVSLLPDNSFPFSWHGMDYHAVVEVEGFLIDWTAKQFDLDAPFPMVWRLEA